MLAGDALAATNGGQRPQDGVLSDAVGREEAGRIAAVRAGQRQQQVLGADVLVAHAGGDLFRLVQGARQFARKPHLRRRAIDLRFALQLPGQRQPHLPWIGLQFLDDLRHDPIGLLKQRQQHVGRLDLAVAVLARQRLSAHNRFLCFLCKFV